MNLPRNRDYPRELVINDDFWVLKFRRNIDTKHYEILGECDYSEYEISIRLKQDRFNTWVTFIHESLHAMAPWLSEHDVKKLEKPLSLFILNNICPIHGRKKRRK